MWESTFPPFVPWPVLLGVDDYRSGCSQLIHTQTSRQQTRLQPILFPSDMSMTLRTNDCHSSCVSVVSVTRSHKTSFSLGSVSLVDQLHLELLLDCWPDFSSEILSLGPFTLRETITWRLLLLEMLLMSYRVKQSRLFWNSSHHCRLYQLWHMIVIIAS